MQPLLRQLLQRRFHLSTHREQKVVTGYAVVIAKGTPKLQTSKGDPTLINIFPEKVIARPVSMKTFAATLSIPSGRPVVDKTGLTGTYDVDLSYAPANDSNSSLPDLFTALQEQLGLKLESQKVPIEMLVIDHLDRIPTEN
jgi:uncharacterized protein (TIGR03435 family)